MNSGQWTVVVLLLFLLALEALVQPGLKNFLSAIGSNTIGKVTS
jgi:hypothetical protein